MEQADIVVYLFDASSEEVGEVAGIRDELTRKGKRFLLVGNKVDRLVLAGDGLAAGGVAADGLSAEGLTGTELTDAGAARSRFASELLISAKEARHVDVLKQRLVDLVLQGAGAGEGTIVTNARHYHALQQVAEALGTIHKGLDDLLSGDLLALDIRHCLHYLGEITGEITSEERLDYIFSKFCIGK